MDAMNSYALLKAADSGDDQTLRLLIQSVGVDVSAVDDPYGMALHMAAMRGFVKCVQVVIVVVMCDAV